MSAIIGRRYNGEKGHASATSTIDTDGLCNHRSFRDSAAILPIMRAEPAPGQDDSCGPMSFPETAGDHTTNHENHNLQNK